MLTRPVAALIRNQVMLTLPPQATARAACQRMRERYVGSVLVTDERDRLLGIFTERDAVCRVLGPCCMDNSVQQQWLTPRPRRIFCADSADSGDSQQDCD